MSWSLRVRGPSGQATLTGVDPAMTVAAFQAMLAEKTGVAAGRQEILGGFPPRPLQIPADPASATLAALSLANGDTLTLREVAGAAPEPAPQAPAAPAAAAPPAGAAAAGAGPPMSDYAMGDDDEDAQLAMAIAASLAESSGAPAAAAQPGPSQLSRPAAAPASAPAPLASAAAASTRPAGDRGYSHPVGHGSQQQQGQQGAPISIRLADGSAVVRRVIDSDNSCLFNAVGYVMERTRSRARELRKVIADAVAADPFTYNEGFLGQSNEDYCKWIQEPQHWGGAIELSILASHYERQIAAYDIQTQRVDVYGQGAGYKERVMLLYDGLHYDAMALAPAAEAQDVEELDVTVFEVAEGGEGMRAKDVEAGAAKLVAAAHQARQFTDTANFTLRCGVCQIGLKGEKEAVEHAKATGHQNFAEY